MGAVQGPGLDAIAAAPEAALTLPRTVLMALAMKAITAHAAIVAALVTVATDKVDTISSEAAVAPMLTVPEAAAVLKVPPAHLYELARRREFPTVRFGRHVRVRCDALARWIEEHRGDVDFSTPPVRRLRPMRRAR